MKRSRIAIARLGIAVVPQARGLLDLADRVEVAYAFSPSAARRAKFAEKFLCPQCDRLETILEDGSVDAVAVLTPPNTHLHMSSVAQSRASTTTAAFPGAAECA